LSLKHDFKRLHGLVTAMSNVLDAPMPEYEIEEDKTKQT